MPSLPSLPTVLALPGVTGRDALVAGVAGAVGVGVFLALPALDDGTGSLPPAGGASWWAVLGVLLAQTLCVLGARRRPRAVLVSTALLAVVAALAGAGDATSTAFVAVVVATFLVASGPSLRGTWPVLAAGTALVAVAAGAAAADAGTPGAALVVGALVQAVGTLGVTVLVAVVVSTRRESARARAAQLFALTRERQALVDMTIARERTAMARELHDIAAHHLSGIAVLTAAIDAQIDTDPAGARAAVRQVREQSVTVLRDLRSLVGLLRQDDADDADDPAGAPRPETIAGIAALVADAAAAGTAVRLTTLSERPVPGEGVGPLAQLAAYRAVQEALANAARHAPGGASEVVVDDRTPGSVVVTVTNGPAAVPAEARPGGGSGGGYGLIGMRERAELTGSALEVGPTDDGGWRVRLRVPREEQP